MKQGEGEYLLQIKSNCYTLNLSCKARIHYSCRQRGLSWGTVRVIPPTILSGAPAFALRLPSWSEVCTLTVTLSSLCPLPGSLSAPCLRPHLSSTNPSLWDLSRPRRNYPPGPKGPLRLFLLSLSVSFLSTLFYYTILIISPSLRSNY